jgi:hypothetical protein
MIGLPQGIKQMWPVLDDLRHRWLAPMGGESPSRKRQGKT